MILFYMVFIRNLLRTDPLIQNVRKTSSLQGLDIRT